MNTEKITARLVLGSSNIDRMTHEIKHTVKMVLGYALRTAGCSREEVDQTFKLSAGKWVVEGLIGSMRGQDNHLMARCWLKIGSTQSLSLAYCSLDGHIPLYTENIQAVHATLDDFVEGMLKTFPGLEERLQPLLEASEKVF